LFRNDVPTPLPPKSEIPSADRSHSQCSRWRLNNVSRAATDQPGLATGRQLPTCVHVWILPRARPISPGAIRTTLRGHMLPIDFYNNNRFPNTPTDPPNPIVAQASLCDGHPFLLRAMCRRDASAQGLLLYREKTTTATATASPSQLLPQPD
jgi:hypothetical protein